MNGMARTSDRARPAEVRGWANSIAPVAVLLVGLVGYAPASAPAQNEPVVATQTQVRQLDQRLQRIERVLDSSAMNELLVLSESVDRELRDLRGEVETLRHDLERLRTRQRDQFRNLDERVASFEARADSAEVAPEQDAVEPLDLPDADEQAAYEEAFDELMDANYSSAMRKLERFIEDYPEGDYAANAWYWLAEAKYAMGEFEAALEDFERLRERFPNSDKSGDALLKIGYSHFELGNLDTAREALEKVRAEYGGTTLDRLARERLRRIEEAE